MDCRQTVHVVDEFRKLCNELNTTKNILEEEVLEADKAFGDIRHYCELHYPTTRSGKTKVCRLIKELSDRRRAAKDALAVLAPLIEFLGENPKLCNEFGKIANGMRKQLNQIEGERHYNPRVLKELFELER